MPAIALVLQPDDLGVVQEAIQDGAGGLRVASILERLAEIRGLPEVITIDNGPEYASCALDE